MESETSLPLKSQMCETILERFDRYIVTQVHHLLLSRNCPSGSAGLDLEIDELVQRVRIKFWQALERRHIRYPYAYIRLIVQSEFVDMIRRQKPFLLLLTEEEWSHIEVEASSDLNIPNPVDEVEQQVEACIRLDETIRNVLNLPPRQQFAMICSLRDRVDDPVQLINAFKAHRIDIEAIQWPAERAEKQLLQASLAPARRTLAKNMKEINV